MGARGAGLELSAPRHFSTVCFRHESADNDELARRATADRADLRGDDEAPRRKCDPPCDRQRVHDRGRRPDAWEVLRGCVRDLRPLGHARRVARRRGRRCSGSGSRRSSRVSDEEFGGAGAESYRAQQTGPLADGIPRARDPERARRGEVAARHEFGRRVLPPAPGRGRPRGASRRGIRLAVLSVCSEEVPAVWAETELAGLFDVETFSSECGLMKPEPEIYLRTAAALGVEPGDCLFVGDGANDELAAPSASG